MGNNGLIDDDRSESSPPVPARPSSAANPRVNRALLLAGAG
jgi:hypothetical protein